MAFIYKLVLEDGTPADPPTLDTAVPNWLPATQSRSAPSRSLRIIDTPAGQQSDGHAVLVVEAV